MGTRIKATLLGAKRNNGREAVNLRELASQTFCLSDSISDFVSRSKTKEVLGFAIRKRARFDAEDISNFFFMARIQFFYGLCCAQFIPVRTTFKLAPRQ